MIELSVPSRIAEVQVYARGAQVTRRASVQLPAGEVELVLEGVTALAEAGSFRAESGGRAVVALKSALVLPGGPVAPGPALAEVRAAAAELHRLEGLHAEVEARRQALLAIPWEPGFDLRDRRLDPARRTSDALAAAGLAGELARELENRLIELNEELRHARDKHERLRLAAEQASSSERAGAAVPTRQVRVRLAAGPVGDGLIAVTYTVAAARWWPTYAARLTDGGARAELELAAFVAQASGEDWRGVKLALSTAELSRDARLPELASLRLSRRQPAAKKGYRPPPPGLDEMFRAYDRAVAALPAPPVPPRPAIPAAAGPPPAARPKRRSRAALDEVTQVGELLADEPVAAMAELAVPMPPPPPMVAPGGPPPPAPAPMMARAAAMAPQAFGGAVPTRKREETGTQFAMAAPAALEPADAWLDFDALVLGPSDSGSRGRLIKAPAVALGPIAAQSVSATEAASPGPLAVDPRSSRGQYDHRYVAEAAVDVPADRVPHRIRLAAAVAPCKLRLVCVPREAAEVYREVELTNPLGAPLLAGPIDVYVEGVLLTTTRLSHVGRGGKLALGLGVEERVRVARNARADEQSAGLLGGATVIEHKVSVELRSSLGRPVNVEVLERVPVSDDDEIEITWAGKPAPDRYDQAEKGAPVRGGLRWRVPIDAGGRATVDWSYRLKLSAKSEIVGGNRRE